jgi:hypothetical protein
MSITIRIPPTSVRVLAVISDQAIRVSIPGVSVGGSGGGGSSAWGDITGKPTEFPPEAHTHPTSDVTGLDTALGLLAPKDSPELTGAPLAPTATGGTNTTQIATTAFVTGAVNAIIAAADAMVFKGVVDCSTNPDYPAADRGWTYKVSVAGKIGGASGVNVEAGDTLLCLTDGTASGDQATVGAQWNITQANLDGAVIGPVSSVDGYFALFSGTSGRLLTSVSPTAVKVALAISAGDVSGLDAAIAANSAVTANTAKVTNATHTGDAAGDTALTLQSAAISGKAEVTAELGVDYMLIGDASDGGALKKALVPAGGTSFPTFPPVPSVLFIGNYYDGALTAGGSTNAGGADRIELRPVSFSVTHTTDQIGFYVTSAGSAGALARVLIYSATADGQVGAKLYESTDLAVDATGYKSDSTPFHFVAGVQYFWGIHWSNDGTVRALSITASHILGKRNSGANSDYMVGLRETVTFGSAPATWTNDSSQMAFNFGPAAVIYRVGSIP